MGGTEGRRRETSQGSFRFSGFSFRDAELRERGGIATNGRGWEEGIEGSRTNHPEISEVPGDRRVDDPTNMSARSFCATGCFTFSHFTAWYRATHYFAKSRPIALPPRLDQLVAFVADIHGVRDDLPVVV